VKYRGAAKYRDIIHFLAKSATLSPFNHGMGNMPGFGKFKASSGDEFRWE
jgi:hypothetical protein